MISFSSTEDLSAPADKVRHSLGGGRPEDRAAATISAEFVTVSDYVELAETFEALSARSVAPNPFIHPQVVGSLAPTYPKNSILVIVVHRTTDDTRNLVGAWVLRKLRDVWSAGLPILQAPFDARYHLTAEPVLDREHGALAFEAMLSLIASDRRLPKVIRAVCWPTDILLPASSSVTVLKTEGWTRAMMRPTSNTSFEDYLRASLGKNARKRMTGKKALLRQCNVEEQSLRGFNIAEGLETFMTLESKGWKGKAHTALACLPQDADRVRCVMTTLAACDLAAVDLLLVDGKAIAAGLLVESGRRTFFWKTTYDEDWRRHSPGVLLDMAVTRRLLDQSAGLELDSGMMGFTDPDSQIWSERRSFSRALIILNDAFTGQAIARLEQLHQGLREIRNRRRSRRR